MKETSDLLIDIINRVIGLHPNAIYIKNREPWNVAARRMYYVIMREKYKGILSLEKMGETFNQDHSTVVNSIRVHSREYGTWNEYTLQFNEVEDIFKNSSIKLLYSKTKKSELIRELKTIYEDRVKIEQKIDAIETELKSRDEI